MSNAEFMLNHLIEEGFRPQLDADGDISFKFQGDKYWLLFDSNDDTYMRLGAWYRITTETPMLLRLETANTLSKEYKALKTFVTAEGDMVEFAIQGFYRTPAEFASFLDRLIRIIDAASTEYFQKLRA